MSDPQFRLLVNRIIKGVASEAEVASITSRAAAELQAFNEKGRVSKGDIDRIGDLINILGYASDTSYRHLIEPYLDGPNTVLADEAMGTLFGLYGLGGEYIDKIIELMRGVPWDPFDDVRMLAIAEAGHYLQSASNPALLHELVRIVEDPAEEKYLRSYAYEDLTKIPGVDISTLAEPGD